MDNTGYQFQFTDNSTTTGTYWTEIGYTDPRLNMDYCYWKYIFSSPEKEDRMEVWEYVIVMLDEDDEKVEVKESGFVVAKDRDRAIAKAASEYAIADNEMVLVRKFCA